MATQPKKYILLVGQFKQMTVGTWVSKPSGLTNLKLQELNTQTQMLHFLIR